MQITKVQNNILSRYDQHGRKLPRRETQDPYAIHISEVMLQQTQVDRVIPYYHRWLKDFPDYETLAKASKTEVLSHRSGLGFNSRALRLQECAKEIIENWALFRNWKLEIRNSKDVGADNIRLELQKLPWVWPYTSAAIMAFARNQEVPVIDTNIRRVLIFLFKLPETISAKELEAFATKIIPKGKSRDRHNALMDYGAMELTARKTKIKSLSKQSKFEGSDRQVRGWIMKYLVKHWELNIKAIEEEFPWKKVKEIINPMEKEWLITIKNWVISIAK